MTHVSTALDPRIIFQGKQLFDLNPFKDHTINSRNKTRRTFDSKKLNDTNH